MSHCWNEDGTSFSVVCSVVIGVSILVFCASVFCIIKIAVMARKLKRDQRRIATDTQKGVEETIPLEEYSKNTADDTDTIRTVESSFVTASP